MTPERMNFGIFMAPFHRTSDTATPAARQREVTDEGLRVIIRINTGAEPITCGTDWFKLRDAQLQLKPYQRPHMPMAVASTLSPAGMQCAGKHGAGVLSVASYAP